MKKLILFIQFIAVIAISANAQYFSHLYGDPYPTPIVGLDYVRGVNTTNMAFGHLMASSARDFSLPSGAQVTYTDENGVPFFNNIYTITQGWPEGGGYYKNLVFEWDHAPHIGVVGIADDMGGETVYYMQLDQMGNVMAIYGYDLTFITANNWHVRGITRLAESIDGNYVYVTGVALGPNAVNQDLDFFVLKLEVSTGTLVWSHIYDFGFSAGAASWNMAYDLIESPYSTELLVVGQYGDVAISSWNSKGFLLRVDATTGNPIGGAQIFGSAVPNVGNDLFKSIIVANNTAAGSAGFMIAGTTSDGLPKRGDNGDIWSVKIDPVGNTLWENVYSSAGLNQDDGNDVIERLNPFTGMYEYYYGGSTYPGPPLDLDIMVIKTDEWGNVVPNGQLMFDWLERSVCFELDQFNNAGPTNLNGLSIYANTFGATYGTTQLLHIKTYFNGFMECNDWQNTPLQFHGPGYLYDVTVTTPGDFMPTFWGPLSVAVRPSGDQNICFNPSVPGGSNARMAPEEPKGDKEAVASPNPMVQGSSVAMVKVESEATADVQIAIYDILGKQYYNGQFTLVKGTNQLPVDISNANMAAGMYTIKVIGTNINKNIMLLVK